jgi:hypothetical protein
MYNYTCDVNYSSSTNDDLYRNNLLSAFNVDDVSDQNMTKSMDEIIKEISKIDFFKTIIQKLTIKHKLPIEVCSVLLFSYDYFETFHKCYCQYVCQQGIIDEELKEQMDILVS